ALMLVFFIFTASAARAEGDYPTDITLAHGETYIAIPGFVTYESHRETHSSGWYLRISRDVNPNPVSIKKCDHNENIIDSHETYSTRLWLNPRDEDTATISKDIYDIAFETSQRFGSVTEYEITETRTQNGQVTESVLGTITVTVPPT